MDDVLFHILQAHQSAHGIEVLTSSPEVYKRRFYAARKKSKEEGNDFSHISLRTCPSDPDNKVWLVNNGEGKEPEPGKENP